MKLISNKIILTFSLVTTLYFETQGLASKEFEALKEYAGKHQRIRLSAPPADEPKEMTVDLRRKIESKKKEDTTASEEPTILPEVKLGTNREALVSRSRKLRAEKEQQEALEKSLLELEKLKDTGKYKTGLVEGLINMKKKDIETHKKTMKTSSSETTNPSPDTTGK